MSLRKQYNTFVDSSRTSINQNGENNSQEKNKIEGSSSHSAINSGKVMLKREIGLLEGTSITLGAVIGSGIFISPKGIVESVNSVGLSLLIWFLSGLLSIIGAICYTELGTSFPSSGGDYHYLYEAFGPIPAFLFIWATMMIFVPVNNAILALSFGQYVMQPFYSEECSAAMPDFSLRLIAAASICCLTALNCYGVKGSAQIQNVFSFIKIAALGLIIVAGIVRLCNGHYENFENSFKNSNTDPGSIALAFFSGIYAFGGANTLNAMTEEVKNPNKTLPRSIYIAMFTVIGLYVLANVAYFTAMTPEEMLNSEAVAVTFGDRSLGVVSWSIPIFVAISTFAGLSINIMQSSRILFAGARNGHFPIVLSHIHYERATPTPSLIFLCILSLVYLSTSDVNLLINYAGFIFTLVAVGAGAALIYMRRTKPDLQRPVKVHLIYPILYFIISMFLLVLPMYTAPLEAAIGGGITLTGLPIYFLIVRPENKPEWLNKFMERSTILVQKLFQSLPAELDENN